MRKKALALLLCSILTGSVWGCGFDTDTAGTAKNDSTAWEDAYTDFLIGGKYLEDGDKVSGIAKAALVCLTDDDIPELLVIYCGEIGADEYNSTHQKVYEYNEATKEVRMLIDEQSDIVGGISFLPYHSIYAIATVSFRTALQCKELKVQPDSVEIVETVKFPHQGQAGAPAPKQPEDDALYEKYSIIKDMEAATERDSRYANDERSDAWLTSYDLESYDLLTMHPDQAIPYLKNHIGTGK